MPGDYPHDRSRILPPALTRYTCTFPSCRGRFDFLETEFEVYRQHVLLHYPMAFFCPTCLNTFSTPERLRGHLQGTANSAIERFCSSLDDTYSLGVLNIPTFIPKWLALKMHIWTDCNMFWRGAMDDFSRRIGMSEDHFMILSGRRRLCMPVMGALPPNNPTNVNPQGG